MKKNNSKIVFIFCYIAILLIASTASFGQATDNDYQHFQSKVQPLLSKNVEQFTKEDISFLNSIINTSEDAFGEQNSRLVTSLVKQAKQKKKDYEDFLESKKRMSNTLDELDSEAERRAAAEAREGQLLLENADLKIIVEELQTKIANFEKQAKKLNAVNKQLELDNLASKDLLKTSSDLVAQMLMLMPNISMDKAISDQLPLTLRDSIVNAQCGVARLLKENFSVTIQQLSRNKDFMDSATVYFGQNGKHSSEILSYDENRKALTERLRASGIECANGFASDIDNDMNNFLFSIESGEEIENSFGDFILNNVYWIGPVCLAVLLGIILLIRKTSKKNIEQ